MRSVTYTVAHEGRDKGKVFVLTEMAANRAEKWAIRALQILARSGVDIASFLQSRDQAVAEDEAIRRAGMAGLFVAGTQALICANFTDAEPLLDEMFGCVECVPDPRHADLKRALVDTDIEDVETRLRIRMEVYKLHVGFSPAVAASTSPAAAASQPLRSSPTRTSRRPSRP